MPMKGVFLWAVGLLAVSMVTSEMNLHDTALDTILDLLNSTQLGSTELDDVIGRVLENVGCHDCLCNHGNGTLNQPSTTLLPTLEISTPLDHESWSHLSIAVLYYLTDPDRCQDTGSHNLDTYMDWLVDFGDNPYTNIRGVIQNMLREWPDLEYEEHGDEEDEDEDEEEEDHEDEHEEDKCIDVRKLLRIPQIDSHGEHEEEEEEHHHEEEDDELSEDVEAAEAAAWLVVHLYKGWPLSDSCSGIPHAVDMETMLRQLIAPDGGDVITEPEFDAMLAKLGIGSESEGGDEEEEEEEEGHDHKRKKRSTGSRHHGHRRTRETHAECYSPTDLLNIYNVGSMSSIPVDDVISMCPGLLHQQLSDACIADDHDDEVPDDVSDLIRYGAGSGAVLIISLAALLGAIMVPCMNTRAYKYVQSYMIALAASTLIADALLHLIPESFGLHGHGTEAHDEEESSGPEWQDYTIKALIIIAGMFAFFLLESVMEIFRKLTHIEEYPPADVELNNLSNGGPPLYANKGLPEKDHSCSNIKPVAWTVIVGDGLHNFADGLAIGAAFSVGLWSGVSTSLAVLCHEIPHELGDFALLLRAGMTVPKALIANFCSAMLAFGGLYLGISISVDPSARSWIFTVAAGMFIYIGLADMIPELLQLQASGKRWAMICLQILGFLSGVTIMLIISLYEEQIEVGLD